jgi:hypothetical protein
MKFPRAAGFTVLIVAGVAVLAVIGLLMHEWWLSTPSDAARRLDEIYDSRPKLADADNAWFDVYGFAAPAGEDAREAGAQRIAWMKRALNNPEGVGEDPGKNRDLTRQRSAVLTRIHDACVRRPGRACGEAMKLNVDGVQLSGEEETLAPRYQALLQRAGSYALVEYDVSQPLPDYSSVMEAQRLMLLRLQGAARRGDVETVRDTLQRDQAFWRRMMVTSNVLVDRMIAVAGLRQHFSFGNFALRELPADQLLAAVPPVWRTPFSIDELSMRGVMAAEYRFTVRLSRLPGYESGMLSLDDEDPIDRLVARVPALRSTQRDLNRVAAVYWGIAQDFHVPVEQYLAAHDKFRKSGADRMLGAIHQYPLRSGSVEGMRRAALATAEIRARSVPASGVAAALAAAPLRDPYDGKPFTWSARENSVIFEAPEESRYTLSYYY